ncbi:MAG: PepSY domain-containing protein, partial [Albidovulum sp.]
TIVAFARQIGFDNRFQLNVPGGETGVWTISRDSMSNDSTHPTEDRTVHIDQYTGKILADVKFADYSVYGKGMAVGIALHEGDMGWWNVALNTIFCLSVIFVSVSGAVMWWMRRPSKARRLAAPPMPRDMPLWQGAVFIGLAVSLAFPMAGLTLLAVLALDVLILSRIPALRRILS